MLRKIIFTTKSLPPPDTVSRNVGKELVQHAINNFRAIEVAPFWNYSEAHVTKDLLSSTSGGGGGGADAAAAAAAKPQTNRVYLRIGAWNDKRSFDLTPEAMEGYLRTKSPLARHVKSAAGRSASLELIAMIEGFDFYPEPSQTVPMLQDAIQRMEGLVKEGYITGWGLSSENSDVPVDVLNEAVFGGSGKKSKKNATSRRSSFAALQLPVNLIERRALGEALLWCRDAGAEFVASRPLTGMVLKEKARQQIFRFADYDEPYPAGYARARDDLLARLDSKRVPLWKPEDIGARAPSPEEAEMEDKGRRWLRNLVTDMDEQVSRLRV